MIIGKRDFDLKNKTYIMGILNVTPDSFSDGGQWTKADHALRHVEAMIDEGADIIDVGGESTRPGYTKISVDEECNRVNPIIEEIRKHFDVPISIDTYKAPVALGALQAGADLVNDIWGFKADTQIAEITVKYGAACCLMHNHKEPMYSDFMANVIDDLEDSIYLAKTAGVPDDKIMVDPGVGFAKSYRQNLEVINKLEQLHQLNVPVLLGTSRKSVIGLALSLPIDERLEGTIATTVIGVMKGVSFVRVHDIAANKRAIQMTEEVLYG